MKMNLFLGKPRNLNYDSIVMEFADKGDLYQKICEFKKAGVYFDESDIWRIFIQMVKGLKSLHDLKILHRDLKVVLVEIMLCIERKYLFVW